MKIHYERWIGRFTIGTVVEIKTINHYESLGHVTGFSLNSAREILVDVKECDGETKPYHPSYLTVL